MNAAYDEGVAVTVAAVLSPERFDALIANVYSVPLVRSVKVNEVVFLSLPFMWWKVVPPSVLYWYFLIVMLPGSSQLTATWPSPGVAVRLSGRQEQWEGRSAPRPAFEQRRGIGPVSVVQSGVGVFDAPP